MIVGRLLAVVGWIVLALNAMSFVGVDYRLTLDEPRQR